MGQLAAAGKFNTDFAQIFRHQGTDVIFSFQLWSSGFWPRGSLGTMKQTPVSFHSFISHTRQRKRAFCPLLQGNAAIDPIHSSACPPLSFSTGALYSRKVTLEGEEVSLQIQDTPCVALQVTNGGTEKAHRCGVSQPNSWMEKVSVGSSRNIAVNSAT